MIRRRLNLVIVLVFVGVLPPSAGAQPTSVVRSTDHWAYAPPVRPTPPRIVDPWATTPIDRFVLERLQARGLRPSAPADRARLLRRVSLDLIGLPPTPAEVDAFLVDRSPDAWDTVIDRLLASPHFGEHQAQRWLDLARYADSNGFQADQLRDSWAYRDWVIDALNRDMAFDRFTVEQIAGDLLPDATVAQRIATGFHRTVPCNVEAGVDPEQNRVNQVVDRVNTTATVWLGTTLACAQCHDHKYDPFSQRDYYRMFAVFNNTPLEVRNPNGKAGVEFDFWGPTLDLPYLPEQEVERARLQRRYDAVKARVDQHNADFDQDFASWERRTSAAISQGQPWHALEIASITSTGDETHESLGDRSVLIAGRRPGTTTYTATVRTKLRGITAFKLETLTHPSLPGTGPGRGDDARPNFVLSEFSVTAAADGGPPAPVELRDPRADYSQKNHHITQAIDGNPRKGWAIGGAGFFKDHWATFRTRETVGDGDGTVLTFTLDQNHGRGLTIGRFRLSAFTADPGILDVPKGIAKILRRPAPRTPGQTRRLREAYRKLRPEAALERELREIRARINGIKPPTTLVMVENETPRKTHVFNRGNHRDLGAPVSPGTPPVLHRWAPELPRDRLGLARWLVSPENPLVARVAVNRWWSQLFGEGLVSTEEDFGTRGAPPTHPELLDWLATELVRSGWSRKHVLKLMVQSATYRQSSTASREMRERDPYNRLFTRGPRFRLSAETIRDNALSISGLLSTRRGGPPVFPPQPAGLWRQAGRNEPKYVVADGEDRFRRGVYVVWRRAAPYPSFVLFDGPDRAACHPRRSRTNTPLQALALLNDEAYVEMALAFADRILRERPEADVTTRVTHGFRLALARMPTPRERQHLERMIERELTRLRAAPKEAQRLVRGVRGIKPGPDVDRVELASWWFLASVLLNLDETVTKG